MHLYIYKKIRMCCLLIIIFSEYAYTKINSIIYLSNGSYRNLTGRNRHLYTHTHSRAHTHTHTHTPTHIPSHTHQHSTYTHTYFSTDLLLSGSNYSSFNLSVTKLTVQ